MQEELKKLSKNELYAKGFSRREAVSIHRGIEVNRSNVKKHTHNGFGRYGKH